MHGLDDAPLYAARRHWIINKTGLQGKYDYTLEFLPDPAARWYSATPPAALDEASPPQPMSFDAVPRQRGLKLEPKSGEVDVVIVDRFHKVPADN